MPTVNEALLVKPTHCFGSPADIDTSKEQSHGDMQSLDTDDGRLPTRRLLLDNPEPTLPEDFFERLASAHERYGELYASRMHVPLHESRRQPSSTSTSVGPHYRQVGGDHWLDWRKRMAIEMADDPA